jgi:hypothetical protein
MKTLSVWLGLLCCLSTFPLQAFSPGEYYELRIYRINTKEQEIQLDDYLRTALLPALHRNGLPKVGVFKAIGNDTAAIRLVYLLLPCTSFVQWTNLPTALAKDQVYQQAGKAYLEAPYDKPPYLRMETVLMEAFAGMPHLKIPVLKNKPSQRIYELRSYEGPTEALYLNKVHMFNEGREIEIFTRLAFNEVFFAKVLSGSRMPNLIYLTSFEDMPSREQHWKAFGEDPAWIKLRELPQYQHNVSKADILFLHPADYSDI